MSAFSQDELQSALMTAVANDDKEVAAILLGIGARPHESFADTQTTPFDVALQFGNLALLELMLEHGGDANFISASGSVLGDAIFYDMERKRTVLTEFMLAKGADPRIVWQREGLPAPVNAAGYVDWLLQGAQEPARATLDKILLLVKAQMVRLGDPVRKGIESRKGGKYRL